MTENTGRIADEYYPGAVVTVTGDLKALIEQTVRDSGCDKGWEEIYRYILERSTKGKVCLDPRFKRFVTRLNEELYILKIMEDTTHDGSQRRIRLMLADEGEDLMQKKPVIADLREIAPGDCQEIYPNVQIVCSSRAMEIIEQYAQMQRIEAVVRKILLASKYTTKAFGKPLSVFGVDMLGQLVWFQILHGASEEMQTITIMTVEE